VWWALARVLVAWAAFGQIEASRPVIRPLEPRFRVGPENRPDGSPKTYYTSEDAIKIDHWVVFSLHKERGRSGASGGAGTGSSVPVKPAGQPNRVSYSPIEAEWAGLVAYDLTSGRAIELIPGMESTDPRRASWISGHYPWHENHCAVVITQLKSDAPAESSVGESLWDWNLATNALTPVGRWDEAQLLQLVLDPRLVKATVVSTDAARVKTIELKDQQSGRTTRITAGTLKFADPHGSGSMAALYFGDQTILPQADRRSFVLYDTTDSPPGEKHEEPRFECVDPLSPNGRRWILHASDIRKATGQQGSCIYPVAGLSPGSGWLAVGVTDLGPDSPETLFLVDQQTGKIKRVTNLPTVADGEERSAAVVSLDGAAAAYLSGRELNERPYNLLVQIDLKTGAVLSRTDGRDQLLPGQRIVAFDERGRILIDSAGTLIRVTPGKTPHIERLFALDPPASGRDQTITAAGLRELGGCESLHTLVLSRMSLSDAMLAELGRLAHLEHLELALTGEVTGELSDIGRLRNISSLKIDGAGPAEPLYEGLADLSNLRRLALNGYSAEVPDVGLRQIGQMTNLTGLSVSAGFNEDFELASLRRLKKLTSLSLGWLTITDQDLDTLVGLTELKRFDAAGSVTGSGLRKLRALPHLVDVSLSVYRKDDVDGIVKELSACGGLTRLRLADNNTFSENVLQNLGRLRRLRSLELDHFGVDYGRGSLKGLAECKGLTELVLTNYRLKPTDLAEIVKLPNLTRLDLSNTSLDGVDLRSLSKLNSLARLNLDSSGATPTGLTDARLPELQGLTDLRELRLAGNPISDAGIAELSPLRRLQRLQIAQTQITHGALKSVGRLSNLAELDLFGTAITDAGVADLGGLHQLAVLDLGMTQITDAGLKQLARLGELRCLNLEETPITDAGLKVLVAIPSLEELDLSGTAITDAGLESLKRLPRLRSLSLRRTGITDTGLKRLQALKSLSTLRLGR
jgi:internalin A